MGWIALIIIVVLVILCGIATGGDTFGSLGILLSFLIPIILIILIIRKNGNKKNKEVGEWRKAHPSDAIQINPNSSGIPQTQAISYTIRAGSMYGTPGYELFTPHADLAGGWDVQFTIKNNTNKTINRVIIEVTPVDRVGSVCVDSMRRSTKELEYTGPLRGYSKAKELVSRHLWYDIPLGSLRIGTIHVIFSDGTMQIISPNGQIKNLNSYGEEFE